MSLPKEVRDKIADLLDKTDAVSGEMYAYESGLCRGAEIMQQHADSQAVAFAEWLAKLSPDKKCTVHPPAGSGGSIGMYTLTTQQLFTKFKETL